MAAHNLLIRFSEREWHYNWYNNEFIDHLADGVDGMQFMGDACYYSTYPRPLMCEIFPHDGNAECYGIRGVAKTWLISSYL